MYKFLHWLIIIIMSPGTRPCCKKSILSVEYISLSQIYILAKNYGYTYLRSINSLWRRNGYSGGRFSKYPHKTECHRLGAIYCGFASSQESFV